MKIALKKWLPVLAGFVLLVVVVGCGPAEATASEEDGGGFAFEASTEEPALTEPAPTEQPLAPMPATQEEFCLLAGMAANCLIDDSVVVVIAEQTGIECEILEGDWSQWTYSGNSSVGQTQSGTLSCPVPSEEENAPPIDFAVTIASNSVVGVVVGGEPEVGAVVNLKVVGNGDTHIMNAEKDNGKHKGWDVVGGEITETTTSSAAGTTSGSNVSSTQEPSAEETPLPGCDSSGGQPKKCNP